MHEHLPFLRAIPLFRGIDDEGILALLRCLKARVQYFDKAEVLWDPMQKLPYLGVILEGGLMIQQEDWRGNRSIMGHFKPGDFLGESAIGALEACLPFCLCVREKTSLLMFDNHAMMNPCAKRCDLHMQLLRNMVEVLLQKEMRLLFRIEYLSKRGTREKLMSFLTIQSARAGTRELTLRYTRQELADILSVDRSAMCTELARMQSDGLIRYQGRRIELLMDNPPLG